MEKILHKTVLINEVLEHMAPKSGKTYLDLTFGCGGHTKAILDKEPNCTVIALDWDNSVLKKCAPDLEKEYGERLKILWGNFSDIYKILKKAKIEKVDGILADFGTSQYQINERDGFSFNKDTPLDMRMSHAHNYLTAKIVLDKYPEEKLLKIFSELGQEKNAKIIARAIVQRRKHKKLLSTLDLAELVESVYPAKYKSRMHPATRIFQALRIYVNKELENIKQLLPTAVNYLAENAPFICISFHSLEDRLVKEQFRNNEHLKVITKKPVTATEEEVMRNSSSRSAKLRVAKKLTSSPLQYQRAIR